MWPVSFDYVKSDSVHPNIEHPLLVSTVHVEKTGYRAFLNICFYYTFSTDKFNIEFYTISNHIRNTYLSHKYSPMHIDTCISLSWASRTDQQRRRRGIINRCTCNIWKYKNWCCKNELKITNRMENLWTTFFYDSYWSRCSGSPCSDLPLITGSSDRHHAFRH